MAGSPMNIAAIVTEARRYGVELQADGDVLHVSAKRKPPESVVLKLRTHKLEIIAFLQQHQTVIAADSIALETAHAIRERRFPLPELKVCSFLIGTNGQACRRCGASWLEHYPRPAS
jgi:hypothetical protein